MRNDFFLNYCRLCNLFDGAYLGLIQVSEIRAFAKKINVRCSDFCDANDLNAKTWKQAVKEYAEQIRKGERETI